MTRALLPPAPDPLALGAGCCHHNHLWPDDDTGEHDLPIFVAALYPV